MRGDQLTAPLAEAFSSNPHFRLLKASTRHAMIAARPWADACTGYVREQQPRALFRRSVRLKRSECIPRQTICDTNDGAAKLPKPHTSGGSRKGKGTHWFFASFNPKC